MPLRKNASRKSSTKAVSAAEKLSYIAEDLRPLAVRIDSIHPNDNNPMKHGPANVAAIAASLKEFGQRKPIVVNRSGASIEAGNAVHTAAVSMGWTHIAVVWVEDDPASATGFSLADNRTSQLAEWDAAVLKSLLDDLEKDKPDLYAGLMMRDLHQSIADEAGLNVGLTDPNDIPAEPDEATTKPGDIWILGDHRLLCGDSSKTEDVDRLMDGKSIQLVNTDPPYNVAVAPRTNNAWASGERRGMPRPEFAEAFGGWNMKEAAKGGKPKTDKKLRARDRILKNDFISDEEFERMLEAWFGHIARLLDAGRAFYIWGGYANCANYPAPLKKHGLYFAQAIIWHKMHPVLTRKDFMGDHEWCFYGWREGSGHKYYGPKNITDVWAMKKINPNSMVHLTEKPVDLAVRAIQYSTRLGENVLDLFGGSGSTLIAAEQTGRKAFLMEIDALYCDVIVERWQKFTGRKAKRQTKPK